MPASVAIIMRSKNEMPHLRAALGMLKRQTFRSFKLFAVDSGSTDDSLEELRKSGCTNDLIQIDPNDYVPGQVLNTAISRTDQKIIVLLNADAVPHSNTWLEKLIQPLLSDSADAVFSRQTPRPDARFIVAYDYQRAYNPEKTADHFFSAAACAFKRELWERYPFPCEGYAEDAVWAASCRLFNARFQLVPESEVEHSHNYSMKELFHKKQRHGSSFAKILGQTSSLRKRVYLCSRELARDFLHTCHQRQFRTIPYNIAYRITIHAGLHQGLKDGSP